MKVKAGSWSMLSQEEKLLLLTVISNQSKKQNSNEQRKWCGRSWYAYYQKIGINKIRKTAMKKHGSHQQSFLFYSPIHGNIILYFGCISCLLCSQVCVGIDTVISCFFLDVGHSLSIVLKVIKLEIPLHSMRIYANPPVKNYVNLLSASFNGHFHYSFGNLLAGSKIIFLIGVKMFKPCT